mgnify:CR=1 FL=1
MAQIGWIAAIFVHTSVAVTALIVVGLVLDILRSLGAELDRQADEDDPIDVAPGEVIVR